MHRGAERVRSPVSLQRTSGVQIAEMQSAAAEDATQVRYRHFEGTIKRASTKRPLNLGKYCTVFVQRSKVVDFGAEHMSDTEHHLLASKVPFETAFHGAMAGQPSGLPCAPCAAQLAAC